jgi:hypothetical protein
MDVTIGAGLSRSQPRSTLQLGALAVPAIASLGAGAIHAAAMGVHNEHDQAVLAFGIIAAFQLAWGVVALTSTRTSIAIVGAVGNAALVGGWVMAKTSGISFIDGLEEAESVQFADAAAAGLAAVAVIGVALWLFRGRGFPGGNMALRFTALPIALLTLAAMINAASGHAHAGGHAQGDTAAAGEDAGHAHGGAAPDGNGNDGHDQGVAVPVVKPFDPDEPIDLSGTKGVTPEQQADAENLLAATMLDLPHWSDPAVAEREGWQSIHDGVTGYEHYINRTLFSDGRVLDPDYPESLVYQIDRATGKKELVAAMFMAEPGTTLDNVPTLGGNLLQWHIHNNLCFTATPPHRVAGLTDNQGNCRPPLVKGDQNPMVHVWIRSHPCGPFAALEGIAGGQIKEGEVRWCDEAHGQEHSH